MPLINPSRIVNNVIALIIILWFAFLMWSKLDKQRVKEIFDSMSGMFRNKEEK